MSERVLHVEHSIVWVNSLPGPVLVHGERYSIIAGFPTYADARDRRVGDFSTIFIDGKGAVDVVWHRHGKAWMLVERTR